MKKLPKSWTKVTPLSKKIALVLFIGLPVLTFWWGINYGLKQQHTGQSYVQVANVTSPTLIPTDIPDTSAPLQPGPNLEDIRYTLPAGWTGEIVNNVGPDGNEKALSISAPSNTGGNLSVFSYTYTGGGRRQLFCDITKTCVPTSVFTPMNIGNLSGYEASYLDNSGGGNSYFAAKGDKFFIIYTTHPSYCPGSTCEFDKHYREVISSLVF